MKIRLSLLCAAAALAAVSCTKHPVQPRFGIAATDSLFSRNGISCNVEYRFASILNAGDSPALTAIEQANIGYFFELEDFSGTVQQAAAASIGQFSDIYLADSLLTGSTNMEYEISAESEGTVVDTLVSYTITKWSYTGGAHGIYGTAGHVYSLAGGYELTLADLFTETQLAGMETLLRKKLYEEYETDSDEGLSEQGFFPESIALTENFQIGPAGITFIYNPYEIGCYALGGVEVTFSEEELEALKTGGSGNSGTSETKE